MRKIEPQPPDDTVHIRIGKFRDHYEGCAIDAEGLGSYDFRRVHLPEGYTTAVKVGGVWYWMKKVYRR